jgi:hypothetical protein
VTLLPTIQGIERVGVWVFAVLLIAIALGGVFALVHVLIGPWFDVKDARTVAQQRRDRARRIVLASSEREGR